MTETSSLLAAVLTVVSVVSLSLLSLLCLRCKRNSKIIHEDPQIYNPQTFQRGGSKFTVTQSKTVTRANQISSTTDETPGEFDFGGVQTLSSSLEHDYVAPIAVSVYVNDGMMPDADQTPGIYGNVFPSFPIPDDDDDYENSQFLNQVMKTDDEPDYENETGACT